MWCSSAPLSPSTFVEESRTHMSSRGVLNYQVETSQIQKEQTKRIKLSNIIETIREAQIRAEIPVKKKVQKKKQNNQNAPPKKTHNNRYSSNRVHLYVTAIPPSPQSSNPKYHLTPNVSSQLKIPDLTNLEPPFPRRI